MKTDDAVIRYVLTDPENGRKLYVAPDVEFLDNHATPSARVWAEVYSAHQTLTAAKADAQGWIDMLSVKEFVDDDGFDPESETPGIALARILRNGTLEIYYPAGEQPDVPVIPAGMEPGEIRKAEWLLDDFGIPAGLVKPGFEAGPASCEITARVFERAYIFEAFEKHLDELNGEDLRRMFYPFTDEETGFTLEEIGIATDGHQVTITLSGQVTDPVLMQLTAAMAGRESGRDSDYVPDGVGDAIFELNYGANDAAGANDFGFELDEWRTLGTPAAETDGPGM